MSTAQSQPQNPKVCLEWALAMLDALSRHPLRYLLEAPELRKLVRSVVNKALADDLELYAHEAMRRYRRAPKVVAKPPPKPRDPNKRCHRNRQDEVRRELYAQQNPRLPGL
jgi:hypothetical protein